MSDLWLSFPTSIAALDGFRVWARSTRLPDNIRVSLLDTVLFIEPRETEFEDHTTVKKAVISKLAAVCAGTDLGELCGGEHLVTNDEANLACRPDGSFATWASYNQGLIKLIPVDGAIGLTGELQGTPDWVLEVVSDGSVGKDAQRLRELYHRAGISEYWLIDSRSEDIKFTLLLRRKRNYATATNREGWQKSRVFGKQFRLTRKLGQHNCWRYELECRQD